MLVAVLRWKFYLWPVCRCRPWIEALISLLSTTPHYLNVRADVVILENVARIIPAIVEGLYMAEINRTTRWISPLIDIARDLASTLT